MEPYWENETSLTESASVGRRLWAEATMDSITWPNEVVSKLDTEGMAVTPNLKMEKQAKILLQASNYVAYLVGEGIHLYYTPVMLVLGMLGNSLSLLVMLQTANRRRASGLCLANLALADSLVVIALARYYYSIVLDEGTIDVITCQIFGYMYHVGLQVGAYTLLTMTVDRFLAVYFPLRFELRFTASRTQGTLVVVWLLALLWVIPYVLEVEIIHGGKVCTTFMTGSILSQVYPWLSILVTSVLPFLGLLLLNLLIVCAIRRSRQRVLGQAGHKTDREVQMTITLVTVSCMFLLLTAPGFLRWLVYKFVDPWASPQAYAYSVLFAHIGTKSTLTNSCINFLLYLVTGSRFRKDLARLLSCYWCKNKGHENDHRWKSQSGDNLSGALDTSV